MIQQSIQLIRNAALFAAIATTSMAETRVISLEEQPDWNAVGRVNKAGFNKSGSCTGTLVAPDMILTAAHCTPSGDPGARIVDYVFVAGWNRGEFAASATFAEVYLPEGHTYGPLQIERIHTDIALVRLATPIPEDVVRPLPLSALGDTALAFVGYRNDRLHAPQMSAPSQSRCKTGCAHIFRTLGKIHPSFMPQLSA